MKLYVGNLPYNTSEDDLRSLFSTYGAVSSVAIITDRDTGRSKGFGFVEFGSDDEARNAISALSGQEYGGRALTVNEARPKTQGSGGAEAAAAGTDFTSRKDIHKGGASPPFLLRRTIDDRLSATLDDVRDVRLERWRAGAGALTEKRLMRTMELEGSTCSSTRIAPGRRFLPMSTPRTSATRCSKERCG